MDDTAYLNCQKGDILIVDDNPVNIKLLASMLNDNNYRVRVTTNGARALTAIAAEQPDLIMLDINMPGMDGYEVCSRLKSDPALSHIPVIFISALDAAIDKVKAFAVGGVDYVTKPFQVEEVLARLENQLSIHRLRAELEQKNAELRKMNEDLIRSHEDLEQSHRQADRIFAAFSETLPGTILDEKYSLEEKIGSGGFGMIFRARQLALNRTVAIKLFRPAAGRFTEEELAQVRREGITASRISHPNAVAVLDFCISKFGVPYLVMELLEGHTLSEEMEQANILSLARCAEVIVPVCHVLASAHAAGVIHRDIKPSNIFLHRSKEGEVVKLLDFGIAKLMENNDGGDQHAMASELIGTPEFIPPERWRNQPYSSKADIYSLGVLVYYLLCGQLPFDGFDNSIFSMMQRHLFEEAPAPSSLRRDLPAALDELMQHALAKEPHARPSAEEFARALQAAAIAK